MLTAAVRDLHRCCPGQFEVAVDTSCPFLWENNPYVVPAETLADAEVIPCHYPLISRSNQEKVHFLNGFIDYLNDQLDREVTLSSFCGDIHLSPGERLWPEVMRPFSRSPFPYWILVAGGKYDFTIKWWHTKRFQAVVDALRNEVVFVQVGAMEHYHPRLTGVLDLRGKTPGRTVVSLMHHAAGVVCPVTFLMHLAAAVERPRAQLRARSCIAIAGGREPVAWEKYPDHDFLDTIGDLACCRTGGCWRSRIEPIGDGDEKDSPNHLCVDVVEHLPRCMAMIEPEAVVEAVRRGLDASPSARIVSEQRDRLASNLVQDPVLDALQDG